MGQEETQLSGMELQGKVWAHPPSPRGTALLRRSLAGKDRDAVPTSQEAGSRLGVSGSAYHPTCGRKGVKSLALGGLHNPKISPDPLTGSCSQHRHSRSSLCGAAQPPISRPPPSFPVIAGSPLPGQPVIHAHSSSGKALRRLSSWTHLCE